MSEEKKSAASSRKGKATVCVVNYKTELLTRLCLRSIRKFTRYPADVIVVDNDSKDESLEYLRSLRWIRLIERPGFKASSGSEAHGTALDAGLQACGTEYFVAMHSDTFVHHEGWLEHLVQTAENHPAAVCVGAGKIDLKPKWQVMLKRATDIRKWLKRWRAPGKRDQFYIRTICALYRTDVLRENSLRFAMDVENGMTCGKQLYYELLDRQYRACPLSDREMAGYIHHLAHATMVLNPEFKIRTRTEKKCRKKMREILESRKVKDILSDDSLDR